MPYCHFFDTFVLNVNADENNNSNLEGTHYIRCENFVVNTRTIIYKIAKLCQSCPEQLTITLIHISSGSLNHKDKKWNICNTCQYN